MTIVNTPGTLASMNDPQQQTIQKDNVVPEPPFFGHRLLQAIPLRAVVPYINKTSLYKFQWGYKTQGRNEKEYRDWARHEIDPILTDLIARSEAEGVIQPQAVYGYFPCQSDGNTLIVYDPQDRERERCRFDFPRQQKGRGQCISDFFRSRESGAIDIVAFQLATIGQHASDYARAIFDTDQYQQYLYWHGLNVETTESLAEFVHQRIRGELGFASEDARAIGDMIKQRYRGSRYSFGYPACPNLSDQDKILDLLEADRIGVRLGDEDQLWPEESTSAIVVHHPQAKYFST